MTRPLRAAAIGLIAIAIALTSACTAPAPAHPNASIEVDLRPGRGMPTAALDSTTTNALFTYLDIRGKHAESTFGLTLPADFRGFIVTPDATASEPSTIRVLPNVIYVTDSMGTVRIADVMGTAFDLVWNGAQSGFDADVVAAVDAVRTAP